MAGTPETVRVRLTSPQFIAEHGGKLAAGTAVEVPASTAERWKRIGIAEDAAEGDRTLREQKLAEIARLRAELGDDDAPRDPAPGTQQPAVRSYPARGSRSPGPDRADPAPEPTPPAGT